MFEHVGMHVHVCISFLFISIAVTNAQPKKITLGEKGFICFIILGHSSFLKAVRAGTKVWTFQTGLLAIPQRITSV